jgi:alginate O-acetyltransferase complex protein AlgJ
MSSTARLASPVSPLPRAEGGRGQRARERLLTVLFVAALAAPGAALLLGVRPPAIENRDPAALPRLTLRALRDPAFYAAVDKFVVDAFPLRAVAVEARARLFYALGTPSVPTLVVGRDGWLFLSGEVVARCIWTADETLAMWDAAASSFEAAGKEPWYVIAPDKVTVYPDKLIPNPLLGTPCTSNERASMREGMAARPDTTADLWGPVLDRRRSDPATPIYYTQDSHWNSVGWTAAIRALVTTISPGTWSDASIQSRGETRRLVGLSTVMGIPRFETAPDLRRTDVTVTQRDVPSPLDVRRGRPVIQLVTSGPGRVVPGRTLFLYDSFLGICIPQVASWFADSVWLHVDDLSLHPEVVSALPDFDRVIIERAERLAYLTEYPRILRPLLDRVAPATGAQPAP